MAVLRIRANRSGCVYLSDSPPVAARQGAEAGHSTLDELCLLTVHGILHCLGYDHGTAAEEAEMFGIQRSILEEFLGRPAPVETRH